MAAKDAAFFDQKEYKMKRIIISLVAAALLTAIVTSAAGASKPKPLPQPVCTITAPTVSSNTVRLNGSCHYGKKTAPARWSWQITGETDASDAPLPAQPSSGAGNTVQVPITGGYKLQLVLKLSTPKVTSPKTKAHKAAAKAATVDALLGGYTAVGAQPPDFKSWVVATYPYLGWSQLLNVGEGSPMVHLPTTYMVPPVSVIGTCRLVALPPSPPTDIVPPQNRGNGVSDGTITTTGLQVYGYKVVCDSGYWAEAQLWVRFGYPTDTCELPIAGVTSFTIPAEWGGNISFYANLLTFRPDGQLYAANQWVTNQPNYQVRTKGAIDVCQAYGLPPQNGSPFVVTP